MGLYSPLPGFAVLLLLILAARQVLEWRPGLRRAIEAEAGDPSFLGQLEGLRGLLAIGVLLHHAVVRFLLLPRSPAWGYPPSRFYGQLGSVPVLMFFFLTGFLFWSKLQRNPKIELRGYLLARLRRLGPVYMFAMAWFFALIAVATHLTLHQPPIRVLLEAVRWLGFSLAGLPDVNGLKNTWYLIAGTPWTLAFEWQFYLLLPMLGWFARRPHRSIYLLAMAGMVFAMAGHLLGVPAVLAHASRLSLVYAAHGLAGHLFLSFGVGIAVAALRARWPQGHPFLRSATASWLCVAICAAVFSGLHPKPFRAAESLALGAVFLCLVYGNDLGGCLSSRTALLLGKCSYSLYLCHGLLLSTVIMSIQAVRGSLLFSGWQTWLLIAGCSLLALGVSVACHEFIEAPWMAKKKRRVAARGITALRRERVAATVVG